MESLLVPNQPIRMLGNFEEESFIGLVGVDLDFFRCIQKILETIEC